MTPKQQPVAADLTDERAKFDAWWETVHLEYDASVPDHAWNAWQARAALGSAPATPVTETQEIGELREGLGNIAVKVMGDRLMLKCCHRIDSILASLATPAPIEPLYSRQYEGMDGVDYDRPASRPRESAPATQDKGEGA